MIELLRMALWALTLGGLIAFPLLFGLNTRRWVALLLGAFGTVFTGVLQLVTHTTELALLIQGVGLLLVSACFVTRGHPEAFVDDFSSPERRQAAKSAQWRALTLWLPLLGALVLAYWSEFDS